MDYKLINFDFPQSIVICLSQSNTGNHFMMPSELEVQDQKYELFSVVDISGVHATANVKFEDKFWHINDSFTSEVDYIYNSNSTIFFFDKISC